MSRAHNLTVATIQEQCRGLRLPTVAAQSERLAQEAERANQSHLNYLVELLGAELEERERRKIERRIKEARLPRMKTLEDFDFSAAAHISVKQIHTLAEGSYLERAEPVILIGDSGTGKRISQAGCVWRLASRRSERAL